ncbi:MAG: choice-of-anchor B family protein [Phycisphaeraceae bacterium]|nr:MAG: choice-of-anchor B family protein [Phycisphaeraceae bacterium]
MTSIDPSRLTLARYLLAGAAVAALTLPSFADEDWRKLADRRPPREGQVWTAGDPSRSTPPRFLGDNMYLQAWFPVSAFPGGSNSGNSCWGYTSPSGRRYAIIGLQKGFGFVEVTDPRNAQYVGFIGGPSSLWHDVKVLGHYAYGVSEGGSGIQVMNLANIDNGVVTLARNHSTMGHSTTHTIMSNPASGFLYLAGANVGNGGLVAVSTADPARPAIVGAWTTRYVHEALIVSYTSGPYAGKEIAFCFSAGYGLDIVDVTNKSSMVRIGGNTDYPFRSYCHQGWLSEDRKYLYMDDELDEGVKVWTTTTHVFNVENLSNPIYVGSFSGGTTAIDHNQYVHNGKLYQANYRAGLQVFDLSSSQTSPTLVGSFDTHPEDNRAKFNGAWSTYPFFGDDAILISDIEGGLIVVEFDPRKLVIEPLAAPEVVGPDNTSNTVTVLITGDGTDVVPSTVTLHASINDGPEIIVPAIDNGDGTFTASLPPAPCPSHIDYYFSAQSQTDRTFTHPKRPENGKLRVLVAATATVVYEDLFSTHGFNGWNFGDPSSPDTATSGRWIKMVPNPTVAQPGSGYTGQICWVTDGRAGENPQQYSVGGGKTTLMSPVFNLAGAVDPRVSYWRWFVNGIGSEAANESLTIDISNDGGWTWTNLEVINNASGQDDGGWFYAEHRLAGRIGFTSQMRVRFVAADYPLAFTTVEAAIDDFRVIDVGCTYCPADYNTSGSADVLDLLDFFSDFGLCFDSPLPCGEFGNPDVNADEAVDVLDFLDFLDFFGQGCN